MRRSTLPRRRRKIEIRSSSKKTGATNKCSNKSNINNKKSNINNKSNDAATIIITTRATSTSKDLSESNINNNNQD